MFTTTEHRPLDQAAPVERMLTIHDLADTWGVSTRTISRWVERGTIPPPIVVNRCVHRWRASVINEWLAKQGQPV